ncbi:MAG TPA: hypothetical protein VD926_07830 [Acidimicrobiales bacterium]|nr:hypothetical protein [Acidimicrobiales bacterium]
MGKTYANVTVVGTTAAAVIGALGTAEAYVADAGDHCVVVFAAADELDGFAAGITATLLSRALAVPALEVAVFDDDLLQYQLVLDGAVVDAGAVPVEVAEELAVGEPIPVPDPARLVAALGRGDVDRVAVALARDAIYVSDLHVDLARALALPTWVAGLGFGHLQHGADDRVPVELIRSR